ncbi:MAG: hypothetical protein GF398_08525 [Chitinivibrionales bacterium]|nr:hypothetical protein [Chitinivibrionales bacterium]
MQYFKLLATIALMCTAASAEWNLGALNCRSARNSHRVTPQIDSLLVSTTVSAGQAKTLLTLVVRPGRYCYSARKGIDTIVTLDGTQKIVSQRDCASSSTSAEDSLEITASFNLPTDWVARNLYLWVAGERQTGHIQDRNLANQQYTQIVGRRRDPALLSFSGNGSYNLRIFPAKSDETRRVAIEFLHTFDDSADVIQAQLPLVFNVYSNYSGAESVEPIKYVKVDFNAESGPHAYSLSWPGLGEGTFSHSKSLTYVKERVAELLVGSISASDPSGQAEYAWMGAGPTDSLNYAGFSMRLDDQSLTFEPEPDTRIIVLDVRNEFWDWDDYYAQQRQASKSSPYNYDNNPRSNIWERAQKFAVMCLKSYLDDGQKFNVLIAGSTVQSVFGAPVEANEGNLKQAYDKILAARPSATASTLEAIRAARMQAGNDVVIMISDMYPPYDYSKYENGQYVVSPQGKQYNDDLNAIRTEVLDADLTLFTIDDDWRLYGIAQESGGFRLAGLLNAYGVPYSYTVINGSRLKVPQLPPLFGSSNPRQVTNLKIAGDNLADQAWSFDYQHHYYSVEPVLSGSAYRSYSSYYPVYPQHVFGRMRVAFAFGASRYPSNTFQMTISGKMAGLRFSKKVTALGDGDPVFTHQQHAFRKTEYLASLDWSAYADDIKRIGKSAHIVTRQTSLLALEPGMQLWEDTLLVEQNNANNNAPVTTVTREGIVLDATAYNAKGGAPSYSSNSGATVDDISLNDLIGATPIEELVKAAQGVAAISLAQTRRGFTVRMPRHLSGESIELTMFDIKGRLIAKRIVTPSEVQNAAIGWDVLSHQAQIGRGNVIIRVKIGNVQKTFKSLISTR